MDRLIAAAEANRKFSELLRGVREGRSYTITSHGKAIARIVPAKEVDATRVSARKTLLRHLRSVPIRDIGRWTRDELYERDE